jgi:hypothetical protein
MSQPRKTDLILCSVDPATQRNLEGFSISICKEAKKRGWYASADWTKAGIKIHLQNHDQRRLAEIVQALILGAQKDSWTLAIIEKPCRCPTSEEEETKQVDSGQIKWGSLIHEKLTLKLLDRLPQGAFVVSNLFNGTHSIFAEQVLSRRNRRSVWLRAKQAHAAGRLCNVLWSREDFDRYRSR